MKRFVYILSSLIVALSCQTEGESGALSLTSSNLISFVADIEDVYEFVETKGDSVTTQTITNFGVFAYDSYQSGTGDVASFMVNQCVSRNNDDTWSYSPLKRWGSTVLFYAYSPYAEDDDVNIKSLTNDGDLIIDYVVSEDVASQHDLMLASPIVQSEEDVKFVFSHQLSAVNFAITGDGSRKVTKMVVSGLNNYGRLQQSNDGAIAWSSVGCDAAVEYNVGIISDITPSKTKQMLSADGQMLLMIPQTLPVTAKVEVTTVSVLDSTDVQVLTLSFDSTLSDWAANNQYLYTMNIITSQEADSADIEMRVSIVDWNIIPDIELW